MVIIEKILVNEAWNMPPDECHYYSTNETYKSRCLLLKKIKCLQTKVNDHKLRVMYIEILINQSAESIDCFMTKFYM